MSAVGQTAFVEARNREAREAKERAVKAATSMLGSKKKGTEQVELMLKTLKANNRD